MSKLILVVYEPIHYINNQNTSVKVLFNYE